MNNRVALYIRVSTTDQDYQRQINELNAYCKRNNYDVKYTFTEKVSGAIDSRQEFVKMCSLTKEDVDIVMVWELSRLSRRMSTIIKTIQDFADKQISIISLKENLVTLDQNGNMTASTIIMLSVLSSMVEIERTTIRERTISGKRNKILSGSLSYTPHPPFGYRKENGRLVIDEKQAEIVRNIYTLYINKNSLNDISKIVSMSDKSVHNILTNEVYTGRHYSKTIDDYVYVPAIVTNDEFLLVKEIRDGNRIILRKSINTSPLRHKLFCAKCGGMMSRHGGEKNPNWQCRNSCHFLSFRYATEATEIALKSLENDLGYESIRKDIEEQIETFLKKASNCSEVVYSLEDKIEEMTKKLEILKEVFTPEQLKKEVNEIKMLQKERDKNQTIIDNSILEAKKAQQNLDELKMDESIIDRIYVDGIDSRHKLLTYHIKGREIKIKVRLKKYTYEIL